MGDECRICPDEDIWVVRISIPPNAVHLGRLDIAP